MSSTATTTTQYVEVPPPTNNTLGAEERSRLLRSNRKLGAILGTTPLLVEPTPQAGPSTATAPRRRRVRPEGRVFHSPSSSVSSSETLAISPEPDYVFVRPTTRSAPYQVQAVFDNASPASSRSASPLPGPTSGAGPSAPATRHLKRKQGQEAGLAPITIMFPIPGPSGSKPTRSGANKDKADKGKASQPLLLRLRAAPGPVNPNDNDRPINPDVHSNSPPKPLSPVSSTFNMNVVPPSPTLPPRDSSSNGLSDREKRKKMAKLTRTLGENIPPELVFRAPTLGASTSNPTHSSTTSSSSSSAQVSRRTSLSISRHQVRPSVASVFDSFHKPAKFSPSPKFNPTASLPPLAVAENPAPIASSSREQPSSEKLTKRRHRPRSLTLGTSSALASATATLLHREQEASRGTTSLDMQPPPRAGLMPQSRHIHQPQPSPKPFVQIAQPQAMSPDAQGPYLAVEFGRRKEREWSGEWNMKDMDDVAKKLRGLKGR